MPESPKPFEPHESGAFLHGTKADLAVGEGRGRIYLVEPTGAVENDPNVTDKRHRKPHCSTAGNPYE